MTLWTMRQSDYIDEAKQNNISLVLGCDGCADSLGCLLPYMEASYTTMDLDLNVVSHLSLVQVISFMI